jgi:Mce-associated membrane protein
VADARPTDEVTDEAPNQDLASGGTTETARRRSQLVLAWALSVLLVLALAGTALAVVALTAQHSRDTSRTELLRSGRQLVVDFTTYNYETWQADTQRVLAGATGPFKQEYADTAGPLQAQVVANKATSAGEVLEAAVVSMDDDSAQVIVVADATVTNTALKSGQRRHYRIKLDMVREGDRWLAAGLDAVG